MYIEVHVVLGASIKKNKKTNHSLCRYFFVSAVSKRTHCYIFYINSKRSNVLVSYVCSMPQYSIKCINVIAFLRYLTPSQPPFSIHINLTMLKMTIGSVSTPLPCVVNASRCAVARKEIRAGVGGTAPSYSGIFSPHGGSTRRGGSSCRTGYSGST